VLPHNPSSDFPTCFSPMDQFWSYPTDPSDHSKPIRSLSDNPSPTSEMRGLPRSCGHHMMIAQPRITCATSLVDHLAGGSRPLRVPTLVPFTLFLSYCVLMLLWFLHSRLPHLYAILTQTHLYAPCACSHPCPFPTPCGQPASYRCSPVSVLIAYVSLRPCGSSHYK